jgi:hypothetical protein
MKTSYGLRRRDGCRLRLDGLEVGLVGIVAVSAEEVGLVPVPLPTPTPVHADTPVPVLLAVALPAEAVRLLEGDQLPTREVQPVPVFGIMAVQTPPVLLVMPRDSWSRDRCREKRVAAGLPALPPPPQAR